MFKKVEWISIMFMIFVFLLGGACQFMGSGGGTKDPTPGQDQNLPLATAVAQEPAAGICGSSEEEVVVVTLLPGIPDPRCVIVRSDQMLKIVNKQSETLDVSLGHFQASIPPEGEYVVPAPFGEYLEAGVHHLQVSPCCGGSIWLNMDP
jgi:hypothetical protein